MLNRPLPAPARDVVMVVGRVILGVVLFAHGWQKLMINGIAGTYAQFDKLGIPLAIVSASFASFVEFVGGVLIIVGALTTTVVALDLVVMVGAAGFVHITHGIFAQNGGWELVGVIVAAELALAAFGPGRFSVDHLIARRHDHERDELQRRMRRPVRRSAGSIRGVRARRRARGSPFLPERRVRRGRAGRTGRGGCPGGHVCVHHCRPGRGCGVSGCPLAPGRRACRRSRSPWLPRSRRRPRAQLAAPVGASVSHG